MTRKMKDSGVEWIGEIPEDWEMVKLKNIAKIITGNTPSMNNEEYYSNSKGIPWIKPDNLLEFNGVSDTKLKLTETGKVQGRIVPKDTMLICAIGSIGKFGYTNEDSAFNQQINGILFNAKVVKKYGLYYMSVQKDQQKYHGNGNVVQILNASNQGMIYFTLPPIEKQKSIANFLDKKTGDIDNIISKTKKAIEEYKKYKQSLITETVTKGLDENVQMKDSGIEWIGDIPEHWDVIRLGFLGRLQNGINKSGEEFGFGYPFINYGDIYRNSHLDKLDYSGLVNSTEKERENYSVKKGDVLFTRTSETKEEIGYAATCLENIEDAVFTGFAIRFRPFEKSKLFAGFSKYYFRSEMHRKYFVKEMNIVTRVSLGQELLMKLSVLLPPLKEQEQIATYLDKKTNQIDEIISTKEKLLIEMEAYKKSLIYEIVTGKREVE